ncbi:FAD/NAD(P)-binding protein [Rubinisphaera margarita]|uniref:FAD/NAD(P)-binding protein n=1 Tax=Rubinisphaera margarita TaxID=2909586 RepID=UPI001EE7D795|nr:FAD/NAD(P)-binding domain-containing protein [Rubinisphaera margarita]MCG6158224.1 FAD/NAD(P)-binding protein [Rubinisphaera margarita]
MSEITFSEKKRDSCTRFAEKPEEFRIAIVGGGPRGLYCLQSLHERLREADPVTLRSSVIVFEPASFPGAGNIYDPGQPHHLRMNFSAGRIDAWPRSEGDIKANSSKLTLVDWLQQRTPGRFNEHSYVPRAIVGEYLHECYRHIEEQLQCCVNFRTVQSPVTGMDRLGTRWRLNASGEEYEFDEVVLTVGHEGWRAPPVEDDSCIDRLVRVFPVTQQLAMSRTPSGQVVGVRGFGLTWIDAALSLTEGRGGHFHQNNGRWHYQPSGREPATIIPFSRTGRPMVAKPDESRFVQPPELNDVWNGGRQRIIEVSRSSESIRTAEELWEPVLEAAAAALNVFSAGAPTGSESVRNWFDRWVGSKIDGDAAFSVMQKSYCVATGQAAPEISWALGAAWRNLYPAIVSAVSHGGLNPAAWSDFREITCEMERIAFGPPAENLGRILALCEADLVDLNYLTASLNASKDTLLLSTTKSEVMLDACVNAVIPSPQQISPQGPMRQLLDAGMISRRSGAEGIDVDRAGRPMRDGLRLTENLAIFGRATEGCILGNDTLSRKLHEHPRHWAREVVARMHARRKLDVGP